MNLNSYLIPYMKGSLSNMGWRLRANAVQLLKETGRKFDKVLGNNFFLDVIQQNKTKKPTDSKNKYKLYFI